jgi:hypothetical protein
MATVIAGMMTSLDGFVADARGGFAPSRWWAARTPCTRCCAPGWSTSSGIDVLPVLVDSGLRFLANIERAQLEKIGVQEASARTTLGFHIRGR